MIEDDDSFVQQEGLDVQDDADRPAGTRRLLICLVVFILWTLWTTVCFLVFRGSMESALEESGVLPLLSAIQEQEDAAPATRSVSLVYPYADGDTITITVDAPRLGSDAKHDTVEALISSYPYDALSHGALSLVSRECELLGLTARDGICYVDMSQEILSAPELGSYTAFDQIRDSLLLFSDVETVSFLVEGEAADA